MSNKVNNIDYENIERFEPSPLEGLTSEQVNERKKQNLTNKTDQKLGRGYAKIFARHILTFFNIMYIVITVLLAIAAALQVGHVVEKADKITLSDFTFLLIVTINVVIGIVQEIRSKRTIDKLTLLSEPKAVVIRNGKKQEININDIVLDDILCLTIGKEITADSIVVEGELEVNESQLTGESNAISKKIGDILYSGSFVVSGNCYAQVEHVGMANEINKLTSQAKSYKRPKSIILGSLGIFLKVVAVFFVITGISMLALYMTKYNENFSVAVKSTAAALIGMIPAGIYLITSVSLALSSMRLAKRKTLVQDMYCIEMLARTDVLCLDKTGTLTDGTMSVIRFVDKRVVSDNPFEEKVKIEDIISSMNKALMDTNTTSKALVNYFGYSRIYKPIEKMPFSSERKYSVVAFNKLGNFLIGAPEILLKNSYKKYAQEVTEYAKEGLRVVALVHSKENIDKIIEKGISDTPELYALILIEDQIRPDAYNTIKYFKENDVQIKIISGDNPITVSEVARRVGVERANEYISLDGMSDEDVYQIANSYTVFGRVKPEQKKIIVKALKDSGKTVAMTGDGVNDIPALKEADCSIAMASGNDAVRKVVQLVLLDSNFSSMPDVVKEGRRVINNVERSASLFLVKTLFVILLAILTIIGFVGKFAPDGDGTFPIGSTKQLLLLELFAIGLPSFYLAIQSDFTKIKGHFLYNVLKKALPGALAITIEVMVAYLFAKMLGLSPAEVKTLSVICATGTCFMVLFLAFKPFNKQRIIVFVSLVSIVLFTIILSMAHIEFTIPLGNIFNLDFLNITVNFNTIFGFEKLHVLIQTPLEGGGFEYTVNANGLMLAIILVMFSYVLITAITALVNTLEKRWNDSFNEDMLEFTDQGRTIEEFFLNRKKRKK